MAILRNAPFMYGLSACATGLLIVGYASYKANIIDDLARKNSEKISEYLDRARTEHISNDEFDDYVRRSNIQRKDLELKERCERVMIASTLCSFVGLCSIGVGMFEERNKIKRTENERLEDIYF